jgi:hypothetical protein
MLYSVLKKVSCVLWIRGEIFDNAFVSNNKRVDAQIVLIVAEVQKAFVTRILC